MERFSEVLIGVALGLVVIGLTVQSVALRRKQWSPPPNDRLREGLIRAASFFLIVVFGATIVSAAATSTERERQMRLLRERYDRESDDSSSSGTSWGKPDPGAPR